MFASKEEFIMKGSDWIFSKVIYLEICYAVYSPLKMWKLHQRTHGIAEEQVFSKHKK